LLDEYRKRKARLEKIEAKRSEFLEKDEPEYTKYFAQKFGAELTRQRELSLKIHLAELRAEQLRFMACEEDLSLQEYYEFIEGETDAERDFWAVLDDEIRRWQEQQQAYTDDFERFLKGMEEESNEEGEPFEDEDHDDVDEDFKTFFDEAREFFGFFDDDSGEFENKGETAPFSERTDGSLKRIYRDLCLRFHPDRFGPHDAKMQRLWISIQDAFQRGDLAKLRAIHAGIELDASPKNVLLSCSDILDVMFEIEIAIEEINEEIRRQKRMPSWGFSKLKPAKRAKVEQEIETSLRAEGVALENRLKRAEAVIERMRMRPKPHRARNKANVGKNHPDLFSFS
jgi:hypothetical protein